VSAIESEFIDPRVREKASSILQYLGVDGGGRLSFWYFTQLFRCAVTARIWDVVKRINTKTAI
jgi:hypothetical protein